MSVPLLIRETITRRRYSATSIGADGRPSNPTTTDEDIVASVQPASMDDRQTLPEGERAREALRIYTASELRVIEPDRAGPGDAVVVDDVVYQVRMVSRYRRLQPHYKAIAVRVQEVAG